VLWRIGEYSGHGPALALLRAALALPV